MDKKLGGFASEGGIKCDGCWIAPWTLLIRGEKTQKPHTQTKQVRKGGLAEKGEMGNKTLRLEDSKENGLRKQKLCTLQGRAFWNDIFQFLMLWEN